MCKFKNICVFLFFLFLLSCHEYELVELRIISIERISENQVYILTEAGGDNFYLHFIKIEFNDNADNPYGLFRHDKNGISFVNNRATLYFSNLSKAREWFSADRRQITIY